MADEQASQSLFAMIATVAPALSTYTQQRVVDELWHRPGLCARDRALVTVSALVARNATLAYPHYFNKALDSGLTPDEIGELLTHLGLYASLANAFGAIAAVREVFAQRGVAPDLQAAAAPPLRSLEDVVPAALRDALFGLQQADAVSPALVHFTDELLVQDLWRRPGLAPRERALATLAAWAALGQVERLPAGLALAMHHGLTQGEFGEALAHIAFYCGWGLAQKAAVAVA